MKSNFYGNRKSLLAVFICAAFLSGSHVAYAVNESLLVSAYQQPSKIKGTVIDANGEVVIGASVVVKGTANGTITDIDGNFILSDVPTNGTIQVSFVGYKTLEIPVKGQTSFSLTLMDDTEVLDEVVVVGYGTMKKSDLTGSVGSISSEKLAARGTTRLEDALQGAVPGVNITQSNSRAGGGFNIQIRGQASINKQAAPLYVIDGIVCSSMDFLNPEDIERVDVLKDASSTAIYGSRASAGVIMITTKGAKGAGKPQHVSISYDGYYGIRKVARMPDFMNAQEFIDYRFARHTLLTSDVFDGSSRKGVDANGIPHYEIKQSDLETTFLKRDGGTNYRDSQIYEMMMSGTDGYDWTDLVTRTGNQQNHYISANGATEKINYRLGVGYQGEENVFKHNDYSRFNIKGAFDGKISKVFEAGLSVNMAYTVQDDFSTDGTYCPYENAFYFNPFVAPYDENGNIINNPGSKDAFGSTGQFTSTVSPLNDLEDENYTNQTRKFHVFTRWRN